MEKRHPQISTEVGFSANHEMKPHSQAKVALYESYLERYLAIISVSSFFSAINIFDVFCGAGVYDNGKEGSPIVAYNAILNTKRYLEGMGKTIAPVSLIVNDGNKDSIAQVKEALKAKDAENDCCDIYCNNLDAEEMLQIIIDSLPRQKSGTRNLILIDPTGYKEIKKSTIQKLLRFNSSEVILFLPVSFMYRFKDVVQQNLENPSYAPLRNFIYDFFPEEHPIRKFESMDVFGFMDYIKEELSFGDNFYTTRFFLENNRGNYYALFFITPNILGLERIIDAKWDIDSKAGVGFRWDANRLQVDLFPENELELRMQKLEKMLAEYIKNKPDCTNFELYEFILRNNFRIPHATRIFKKWQQGEGQKLEVWDVAKQKVCKNAFHLRYDFHKKKEIKVTYKLL